MKCRLLFFSLLFYVNGFSNNLPIRFSENDTPLVVHRCNDFTITGKGDNEEWSKTKWTSLQKIDTGGKENKTRFKILYSPAGIYVLFDGDDEQINSPFKNDFENLFQADVFEVFFHPNTAEPVYFEYEVSPLDKELVLLIFNMDGKFGSWMPWHYEGKNRVTKKINIEAGKTENKASIKSWSAELFFPYRLLPFKKVPPEAGTRWNANFCRLDYDSGHMIKWSWSPIAVSFHEFKKYLPLLFE